MEYHVPAALDDVLVTCLHQLLLTSAELTYFASQIEWRSGLAAGFGKPSPVEQHDSCLTELCSIVTVVIAGKKWTFMGPADFAPVVVLLPSYSV